MTYHFLDSSALIKRYVIENGTMWIRSLVAQHDILIAQITQVEVVSGTMRRYRENAISLQTANGIRLLIDRHANRDYQIIKINKDVIQAAEHLLVKYPLRAYDSIQLASALIANHRLVQANTSMLIFVSADTRLITAASGEGLATDNPNLHP